MTARHAATALPKDETCSKAAHGWSHEVVAAGTWNNYVDCLVLNSKSVLTVAILLDAYVIRID